MPASRLVESLRERARALKHETHALALAYADPRTPTAARVVVALVVAYALSPIDLIPDPIPVLGYLDDLILVPAGIALALKLIPREVMDDAREAAADPETETRLGRRGAIVVGVVWLLLLLVAVAWTVRVLSRR